jgi:hypothetical protein
VERFVLLLWWVSFLWGESGSTFSYNDSTNDMMKKDGMIYPSFLINSKQSDHVNDSWKDQSEYELAATLL